MANFSEAYTELLENEGGYANDPDDTGGETYKGIARNFWPKWQGWPIIDAYKSKPNFPLNLEQNPSLPIFVKDFYKLNFWDKIQGDKITAQENAFCIFDFAVNTGIKPAVILAQQALNIKADGILGNGTLEALNKAEPASFIPLFTVFKIIRYIHICRKEPKNKKFFWNWVCRAIEG